MTDQLIMQLDDMAHGGDAVGRYEGKVIFVPYGIPGESVRVEILRDRGRFAHGRLVEVLEPSPQRVEPPCPYFGECGGCQWQHIGYDAQLQYKQAIVETQLERIAGIPTPTVLPPLGMTEPWSYRNHMQFTARRDGQVGLMASGSHRIVPVDHCLLMHPLLEDMFDALDIDLSLHERFSLRAGVNTGEQMIILQLAEDLAPEIELDLPISCVLLLSDGTPVTLVGYPYIHEQLAGRTFRISAPSFFQVNSLQASRLVALVSSYLRPGPDSVIVDAYCGVGTLSLGLASRAKQLIGLETNVAAISDARTNAADLDNATFVAGRVEEVTLSIADGPPLVIVDPPRTGMEKDALAALTDLAPPRIVYVSCDPATLARDVSRMAASGYRLREAQPVDLFPQTHHIECVAVLDLV